MLLKQKNERAPILLSHFVWVGSEFTEDLFNKMLELNVTNQREFFQPAYSLHPMLWVDRPVKRAVETMLSDRGIEVHHINELYSGLLASQSQEAKMVFTEEIVENIRKHISRESGLTTPFNSQAKSPAEQYMPNPALAKDIIEIMLGYLHPGFFSDIGLQAQSSVLKSAEWNNRQQASQQASKLRCCINSQGRFDESLKFVAAEGDLGKIINFKNRSREFNRGGYDLQEMYTTNTPECKNMCKEFLQKVGETEDAFLRQYGEPEKRGLSWTGMIFDRVIRSHRQNIDNGQVSSIPIKEFDSKVPAFAGLSYKNRKNSPILDYKETYNEKKIISSFRNKAGNETKIGDHKEHLLLKRAVSMPSKQQCKQQWVRAKILPDTEQFAADAKAAIETNTVASFIKAFLNKYNINCLDKDGTSVIIILAQYNYTAIAREFIKQSLAATQATNKLNLACTDSEGFNALMYAVLNDEDSEFAKMILETLQLPEFKEQFSTVMQQTTNFDAEDVFKLSKRTENKAIHDMLSEYNNKINTPDSMDASLK